MLIPMQVLHDSHNIKPKGIVHLGAHLGEEAIDYDRVGVKNVLWVEANPHLIGLLGAHVSQYPGQIAVQALISDQDDVDTTFYTASFSMSSSILKMTGHLRQYPTIVEIGADNYPSVTIDTLMNSLKLNPADYDMLNVDLEGAELMAMRGGPVLLSKVNTIYTEVYFEDLYEGCSLVDTLDAFLLDYGFKRTLTEDAYLDGQFKGFGDALYQR